MPCSPLGGGALVPRHLIFRKLLCQARFTERSLFDETHLLEHFFTPHLQLVGPQLFSLKLHDGVVVILGYALHVLAPLLGLVTRDFSPSASAGQGIARGRCVPRKSFFFLSRHGSLPLPQSTS